MHDLTGQQLGKYRLLQSLGAGGYAQVYLGEHIHLKTKFAVKVLDELLNQDAQAKFLIEAQRIASLKHPNIVSVTDFDVIGNTAFLVLEYAPYGTPRRTNGVPMAPQLVASYIKQIAAALQYIHDEKRLVHCDVKPANMLLWENNQLKLSDFGITQLARGNNASTLQQVEGTSAYMAPEHWKGKFVFATDQYSLGVVAYEWLSGNLPFHGSSLDMQRQHLQDAPPPLHRRNPVISMTVEQVVNRALHKEPQQRYPRVMDFALALEHALKYTAQPPQRLQATRLQGESLLPPLLMREPQSPRTAPNPMVLASPTSNDFQAHFDPTIPASFTPSTPLPPEEPEMPVHALLLEQQKLVQHFVEVAREQDERRNAIAQQRVTARNDAALNRKQSLAKTDEDVDYVRRCTAEMKAQVKQQGWYGLARKFTRNPFAFKAANTPSQQIHEYRQEADADREIIASFLRQYGDPSTFYKVCMRVGGASAALIGFVWGVFIIGSLHLWNDFTIFGWLLVMMLVFVGTTIWFGASRITSMGKALYHLKQLNALTEEIQHARRQIIEESYQRELDRIEQDVQHAVKQLMQELHQQLPVRQTEVDDFMKKLGFAGSDWNNQPLQEQWQERRTISASPSVTRIGKLTVNAMPALPAIPALVSCPNGSNLLLEASGAAKSAAISAALSCILRILLTQTPGNVHFTFIDPTRYGRNFEPLLWLSEHADTLLTGGVVAEPQQIGQQLTELTAHIARITRQYSHSLKEVVEPYRVLVVMDFPANFTAETAQQLLAIARNGPRCGISTVVVIDEARSLQTLHDFELSSLEQLATVIRWNGQNFILQSDEVQDCYLELDRLPEENIYRPLIQSLQDTMRAASSVEQNPLLQELLERPTWLGPHEQARLWLGYPVTSKEPLVCTLHRQSDSNLLIVGKQRDVGTGMLLTEIMSIAAQQSPARAQFAILDVSVGDMSATYGAGIQPFEFIKQLLPGYKMHIVHRRNLQSELPSLMSALRTAMRSRRQSDSAEKSSLYIFICGLHRLNDLWQNEQGNENQIARQTMQLLQDILGNGPEFGIHTLTWCDTLSGLDNVLGANMLRHFDIRVAFPTSPREEILTLVERSGLPALGSGQALYCNRDEMRLEKFRPFQLPSKAWLQQAAALIQRKVEANM